MSLDGSALKRALERVREEAKESYERAHGRLVERQEEARLRLQSTYGEIARRFAEKLR